MATIQGTNVQAPVVPNDTNDVFATTYSRFVAGGLHTGENTLADRDAITAERREWLMQVRTLENGVARTYELVRGLNSQDINDNRNWREVTAPVSGTGDKSLGDWNAATNTPALTATVGTTGTYYRITAIPAVISNYTDVADVNTNKIDIYDTTGYTVGMAVWGEGIPAGTTITAIDTANYILTVSQNVSIPTTGWVYGQAMVIGVPKLVVGNYVFFDGAKWVQRGPFTAATYSTPGAVQPSSDFDIRNGLLRTLAPSWANELAITSATPAVTIGTDLSTVDKATLCYAIMGNVGNKAVRITTTDPYNTFAIQGKVIAIRSEVDGQGISFITPPGQNIKVGGAAVPSPYILYLNAGETVVLKIVNATTFALLLDTRHLGITQVSTTTPGVANSSKVISVNSPTTVSVSLGTGSISIGSAPTGSYFQFMQDGPGQVVLTAPTGVTAHYAAGAGLKSAGQYGPPLVARVIATNEWVITGGVA